ncbi:MAG: hypothetical protein K0R39_2332 [Symbiobacteriaceae bacterium]|jgi:hypothetical protein|nr:hypothetical protein [Symbiobacteriaceae bacterium]
MDLKSFSENLLSEFPSNEFGHSDNPLLWFPSEYDLKQTDV